MWSLVSVPSVRPPAPLPEEAEAEEEEEEERSSTWKGTLWDPL